jgi:radical SAM protein with 4Fe4S-binding SPASM domain
MRSEFMSCGTGDFCKMLLDGRLFACERAARMYHMKKYTSDTDYIELLESDNEEQTFEKIKSMFILQRMDACNYCDLSKFPHKYIETGVQKSGKFSLSGYTVISRERYRKMVQDLPYTPYW